MEEIINGHLTIRVLHGKEAYNFFYKVWYMANMYMSLFAEALCCIKFNKRQRNESY